MVLTIQASRSLTLSDDDDGPAPVTGYFHSWEDYALFGLFVFYTVEAFARICVSGFLLDPEIPTSSLFFETWEACFAESRTTTSGSRATCSCTDPRALPVC